MSRVKTSFVLHSETHRRLYPASEYPVTHFVDRQNVARQCLERSKFLRRAICLFFFFLGLTWFVCASFRTHVYLYNEFLGPFHVDQEALAVHVRNFDEHSWWRLRKEYFQVELGEDNILNPASSAETIRAFSDPDTRQHHIATFKKVHSPWIYVKLPTRSVTYFHRRFPFDFRLFTMSTLQCVAIRLMSDSNNTHAQWFDETEYLSFINEEYGRNSTRFNVLVLTKCGILVGYLYRPEHELAFLPSGAQYFYPSNMALDATTAYTSIVSLLIQSFLPMMLLLSGIYHLFTYVLVPIRVQYLHSSGIFPFSLELSADLVEELHLLNSNEPVERQLLQLDSYLARSKHRFRNRMFVIENDSHHIFVLFLQVNLNSPVSQMPIDETPVLICPVTDIQRIVHDRGICYGPDSSWIPWPRGIVNSPQNCSEWLHAVLMLTSVHYRRQHDTRVRDWHLEDSLDVRNTNFALRQRRNPPESTGISFRDQVSQLIREEENIQRLIREHQGFFERISYSATPASERFIARFEQDQLLHPTVCDAAMAREEIVCTVCLEQLQVNQTYATWPCASQPPHRFHSTCMLELLHTQNTCPLCRHPVETDIVSTPHLALRTFLRRYVGSIL